MRCEASRLDGSPCGSTIVGESGYCFPHDPAREEERRQARARGGSATSNVARLRRHLQPSHLGPIFDRLESALAEVHSGELAPARASAMANLARAMVATLTAGELEARLVELEARWSA